MTSSVGFKDAREWGKRRLFVRYDPGNRNSFTAGYDTFGGKV